MTRVATEHSPKASDQTVADVDAADLFLRVAVGDQAAFALFYDLSVRRLHALAYRILNNASDADEVVQETYLAIWNLAPQFDVARGGPLGWAATICRRKAIDLWRSRKRHARLLEGKVGVLYDETAPAPASDHANHVRNAVSTLHQDDRELLELAFFRGKSHREIAHHRSQPLGTVKARIRRSLLKLRGSLVILHAEAC